MNTKAKRMEAAGSKENMLLCCGLMAGRRAGSVASASQVTPVCSHCSHWRKEEKDAPGFHIHTETTQMGIASNTERTPHLQSWEPGIM